MNRNYCIASGIVFALVSLAHVWRFVLDLPMQIGAWHVARSLSGVAAVGSALLAVWAFKSAGAGKTPTVAYT